MKLIGRGATMGVILGLIISIVNSYVFAAGVYYPMSPFSTSGAFFYERLSETTTFIIALLVWALVGIVSIFAGKIYSIETWSIAKMTVVHLLTMFIFFLPLSIIGGWYPLKTSAILSFIIIFIIIYFIIWATLLLINIYRIKKINHKLNN